MSAAPPPGAVEARLDGQTRRVVRAGLCRNDRFVDLRRVRDGRWEDPIGQLDRAEAIRLHRGLGSLIAVMPEDEQ